MKGKVWDRQPDGSMREIIVEPVFLTQEQGQADDKPTLNGKFDARCIVCLERAYMLWIDDTPPPVGCGFGHTKKEDCKDLALPRACFRGQIQYLKNNGKISS